MEYFIGQEIELIHDNKTIKLKVKETNRMTCKNCFFNINNKTIRKCIRDNYNMIDAFCSNIFRKDKKNIIFKQIK